jgi:hypothetical protein
VDGKLGERLEQGTWLRLLFLGYLTCTNRAYKFLPAYGARQREGESWRYTKIRIFVFPLEDDSAKGESY